MTIIPEKKIQEAPPTTSSGGKWTPSDKKQLLIDIRKYIQLGGRFTLIHIGPDHALIKEAAAGKGSSGMVLFTDNDGLTVGFHESSVGNRIEAFTSTGGRVTAYSFFVGRKEMELWIEY
jgi:hypothetical protein